MTFLSKKSNQHDQDDRDIKVETLALCAADASQAASQPE
jgi:hypothetical protein